MDSQGKALIYSTYLPQDPAGRTWTAVTAMTVDKAGNAWLGGPSFVARLDPYGATIPASTFQQNLSIAALVLDAESNLYATGSVGLNNVNSPALVFPATPGVFQPLPKPLAPLPAGQFMPGGGSDAFVIRWDKTLQTIQAATLLGGEGADAGESIALDGEGNVLVSGRTDSLGFPTRLPFQTSFAPRTGFLAALDAKLTTLRFSTYLGNRTPFEARAATLDAQGGILLAGSTLNSNGSFIGGQNGAQFTNGGEIYANRLSLGAATEVQLDTVVNAASRLAAPLAPGEPIVLAGAGFGADARVLLDGEEVKPISGSANQLVAIVPEGAKTSGEFRIQVSTGGKVSNTVLVPATVASPGIYTTDGSGFGQGYILNRDGALNSAENPAAPGEAITIYAAGVGRYSTKDGYTVTDLPPSVYVGGFYANGIAAVTEPVEGLPGKVYKLSVFVPSYEQLVAGNPDLKSFRFPPQVAIRLVMGTVNGLNWANSNGISQPGIVLNLK
jgi:uncharacterized protein (TIGR03437 family)